MANELAQRLSYADVVTAPSTEINYYLNYSAYRGREGRADAAFFTHIENASEAKDRFFRIARSVNACVCHSAPSQKQLASAGITNAVVIAPGVDLRKFDARLKIGVVGRTYHTGRKGEHLVAQVMDIPGIEWEFTGSGWPGRSIHLPQEDLPAFYRSLDYLLVPSLQEAGPMSVIEALACGTPVIAPPIGWIPEYPHVEFRTGDVDDLRRVLTGLLDKKLQLRASVSGRTWESWAEKHDTLFTRLARECGLRSWLTIAGSQLVSSIGRGLGIPQVNATSTQKVKITLRSHGPERHSLGGPSVRIPILAKRLRWAGYDVSLEHSGYANIVHVFNAWSSSSALDALREAKAAGSLVVFSPIFLELSDQLLWETRLLSALKASNSVAEAVASFAEIRSLRAIVRASDRKPEPVPGYFAHLKEMFSLVDAAIFLSEAERDSLSSLGVTLPHHTKIVPNPANTPTSPPAKSLFEKQFGISDYVLCIGRLEPRKNQLALVLALRETNIPLVLIGHSTHPEYRRLIDLYRWDGLIIIDRLDNDSPLFWSALAGAQIFALPSWAEGGPLAALEAASVGCKLILTDGRGEREYFGKWATYVDPSDPLALKEAILHESQRVRSKHEINAQIKFFRKRYSWERHVEATRHLYNGLLEKEKIPGIHAKPQPGSSHIPTTPPLVLYDITTLANHGGRWTGIPRVEAQIARHLGSVLAGRLRFVAWHDKTEQMVPISNASVYAGTASRELETYDDAHLPVLQESRGGRLIVVGSAWMQNTRYTLTIANIVDTLDLRLTLVLHDCFPLSFPHWYPENYTPVFRENLLSLLSVSSSVVAVSQATATALRVALGAGHPALANLPIEIFREGDELDSADGEFVSDSIQESLRDVKFVLAVGAIHARKNYGLLYQVWLRLVDEMKSNCPLLIIVGGVAWNGKETADALTKDPRLNGLVRLLEDVDDLTLHWLYQSSLLTVYPSFAEGWGLPVAESLRLGSICLASDLPSVREIDQSLVERLDPLDPTGWAARISFYLGSEAAREAAREKIRLGYMPHSWAHAAKDLIEVVEAPSTRERRSAADFGGYAFGTVVRLGQFSGPGFRLGRGWSTPEPWGAAMRTSSSTVKFRLTEPAVGALVFCALLRTPDELRESTVTVSVAGKAIATWHLTGDRFTTRYAVLQPSSVSGLALEIQLDTAAAGLGVCCFALSLISNVSSIETLMGQPRHGSDFGSHVSIAGERAYVEARHDLEYPLELEIVLSTNLAEPIADGASLIVNSVFFETYRVSRHARTRLIVTIPSAVRSKRDPIVMDFIAHSFTTHRPLRNRIRIHSVREISLSALQCQALVWNCEGFENFASIGNVGDRLGAAWEVLPDRGIKALATTASLSLRLPSRDGTLTLSLSSQTILPAPGTNNKLDLEISSAGKLLEMVSLSNDEVRDVSIALSPSVVDTGGFINLDFSITPLEDRTTTSNFIIQKIELTDQMMDVVSRPTREINASNIAGEKMVWPARAIRSKNSISGLISPPPCGIGGERY
ncbi:glycosyltransferase [Roseomonas stagni]|uniref:Glycosyltransferase n=1 Tax=Falsiroseomonas algicola TaxID=2716930 RepID=A0A6M1LV97_9PROT|nr:glycosyltransferase [Falsiroseomonas algicola]NGM24390.1 glycosyltransferase [Falsiroseomonas algicola]